MSNYKKYGKILYENKISDNELVSFGSLQKLKTNALVVRTYYHYRYVIAQKDDGLDVYFLDKNDRIIVDSKFSIKKDIIKSSKLSGNWFLSYKYKITLNQEFDNNPFSELICSFNKTKTKMSLSFCKGVNEFKQMLHNIGVKFE